MEDATLSVILMACGAALQYVRQFEKIGDHWYGLIAVLLGTAGFFLMVDPVPGIRPNLIALTAFLVAHVPTILGGTFIMSTSAKAMVEKNPGAARNFAVPLTDSK